MMVRAPRGWAGAPGGVRLERAKMDPEAHWQQVWGSKSPEQVSWYEPDPAT
jgi:hypothetical protein